MLSSTRFRPHAAVLSALILVSTLTAQAETGLEPAANSYATIGMSQILSAQPMGDGRLTLQVRGNIYQQANVFSGVPAKGAQITTTTGAAAYGLNSYLEAFTSVAVYNLRENLNANGSGLGNSALGLQFSVPVSLTVPAWFGIHVGALFGTSKNAIDSNLINGYNYLETRKFADISSRISQTVFFTPGNMELRLHFNEGAISSLEAGKDIVLTGGAGLEFLPIPALILGLEANSRTMLKKPSSTDPLWVTPTIVYRIPVHLNFQLGVDVSASKKYTAGTSNVRVLEPWRAFGSVTFSFDLMAEKRHNAAEKQKRDSLEKISLALERKSLIEKISEAQTKADSLARENSITLAQKRAESDSLSAAADYLAMKARQDSLNLMETQRELQRERSKRSDAEKQLLSTGLLLLDAVYFETGKTEVSINSKPYLNIIAKMLLKYPRLRIEISGHTDNVGSATSNTRLSQGRAESVMQYMIEAAPGLQGMLTAQGYGFSQPKADNQTAEGRKLNRRTELLVLNKEVLREYNR